MLQIISKLGLALSVSSRMLSGSSDGGEAQQSATCWKKASGRTEGQTPDSCPAGTEHDSLLPVCFEESESGYHRTPGTGLYTQDCPSGFHQNLVQPQYCIKPSYTKKYYWWKGCGSCDSGYDQIACTCIKRCPSGMTDNGLGQCEKQSYTRDARPLQCEQGLENEAGICYPPCENQAEGEGAVCWGECPLDTEECGKLCLAPGETCDEYTMKTTKVIVNLAIDAAAQNYFGVVIHSIELDQQIGHDQCSAWTY